MSKQKLLFYICALAAMFIASTACAQSLDELETVKQRKASLKFETVTPEMIVRDFDKGGFRNIHPRAIASKADIQRLKKLIADGDPLALKTWARIKKSADANLTRPFLTGALDGANLRVMGTHHNIDILTTLVAAWWISGEKNYADRAWQVYENMCTWPDWGIATAHPFKDRHYLDTAAGALDTVLVYDGLYDYLSAEQKDFIYKQASKFVFVPTLAQYDGTVKKQWWTVTLNNWNGICNGTVALVALTFMERDSETMSRLAAYALAGLPRYIVEFEPDGQSEEGMGYWQYGLTHTLTALESMQRILGTTYGLGETPGLKKAGYFPAFVTGPVTTLNVGDDPAKNAKSISFFWFAKHFNDPTMARLQYDLIQESGRPASLFDLLCYDPKLVQKGKEITIPLDNHIYGLETSSLLEHWSDPNALYIAMHGGYNGANHGHLDAGTFTLQALGEVWAYGDLGGDKYTYPGYFKKTIPGYMDEPRQQITAGRWHFYRMRAEGKNCLVFNPDVRPDQNPSGRAYIVQKISTPERSAYITELAECYSRDVNAYQRGILLDRNHRVISVQDDFSAKKDSTAWWSMHTKAEIEIAESGRQATLSQKGKKLYIDLIGAEGFKFEILPPTYLPGQEFPKTQNGENKGVRKLAIKMTDCKGGRLRVDFHPSKEHTPEPLLPLTDWK